MRMRPPSVADGKVFTLLKLTVSEQVAFIALRPPLSNAVPVKGSGLMVMEFARLPMPISAAEVEVVTRKFPPTAFEFCLTFMFTEI